MVLGQLADALNNLSGEDVRNILFVVALAAVALIALKHMANSEGLDADMLNQDELDQAIQEQAAESMAAMGNAPMGVPSEVGGMDVSGLIRDNRQLPQFADTTLNPDELLPAQDDDRFLQLHPRGGAGKLSGRNFLASKPHFGVDTQGSSLRNSNQQLRSEPANPMIQNITPWNQTTIDYSDSLRKPMEIGSAPSHNVALPAF